MFDNKVFFSVQSLAELIGDRHQLPWICSSTGN